MLLWRHQTGPRQLGLDSEFEKGIVLDAPALHRVEVYVRQLRVFARVVVLHQCLVRELTCFRQ